jgi:hypothetical protein
MKGEAGRCGEGHDSVAQACLSMPSTPREGCDVVAEFFDRLAAPSTQGEGAGSMEGGRAGPSQQESKREKGPYTTGYSSRFIRPSLSSQLQ